MARSSEGRRRRSKTFKLAVCGTVIAGLLLLAILVSVNRTYGYIGKRFAFLFTFGLLHAGAPDSWREPAGWVFYDAFGSSAIGWEPTYAFKYDQYYTVALWKPLALIVLPTALLWLMNKFRFRAANCQQCGYNLKGNVSGNCSECGTPTGTSERTPWSASSRPDCAPAAATSSRPRAAGSARV